MCGVLVNNVSLFLQQKIPFPEIQIPEIQFTKPAHLFQLSCHAVVKLLEVLLRIFKSSNPLWIDLYWWVPCLAAAWHAVLTINTVARLKALALAKRCSCRHCCFRCCFHRQPFLTLSDLFQVCFRLRKPKG